MPQTDAVDQSKACALLMCLRLRVLASCSRRSSEVTCAAMVTAALAVCSTWCCRASRPTLRCTVNAWCGATQSPRTFF